MGLLVDFLKFTEMSAKKEVKEWKLEWKYKNNQAGEELLID